MSETCRLGSKIETGGSRLIPTDAASMSSSTALQIDLPLSALVTTDVMIIEDVLTAVGNSTYESRAWSKCPYGDDV